MIHLRLSGPSRAGNDTTVIAAKLVANQKAQVTPLFVEPSRHSATQPADTNVTVPNTVVQPDDPNAALIDPATGLPWGKSTTTSTSRGNTDDTAPQRNADGSYVTDKPATGVTTTMPSRHDDKPISGYNCTSDLCRGVGMSDLIFHQLQDAINKGNQHARDLSGGVYLGPSISVNGVIDANTVNALAALSNSGLAPTVSFYDVHLTPQFIADNAQMIIDGINAFLGVVYHDIVTKPPNQEPVSYQCPDGSIVATPAMCSPIPTSPPSSSSPPIVDPSQIPQDPITFVPQAQVVGLSRKGAIGLAVVAVLVGAFVGPKLFSKRA